MQIEENRVVKTSDWFITILLAAIPVVGFILLFVWAFGGNTKPSKANWAKATLLWLFVGAVVYGVIAMTIGAAFFATQLS
ncbi:MAG: hypothetical protein RIC95_10935 [Vicingaceae bacterium]